MVISSHSSKVFFAAWAHELSTNCSLSRVHRNTTTRPVKAFLYYALDMYASFKFIPCSLSKVKLLADHDHSRREKMALRTMFGYLVWMKGLQKVELLRYPLLAAYGSP